MALIHSFSRQTRIQVNHIFIVSLDIVCAFGMTDHVNEFNLSFFVRILQLCKVTCGVDLERCWSDGGSERHGGNMTTNGWDVKASDGKR